MRNLAEELEFAEGREFAVTFRVGVSASTLTKKFRNRPIVFHYPSHNTVKYCNTEAEAQSLADALENVLNPKL